MIIFTELVIKCPKCGKKGMIDVLEDKIKSSLRGILAVNIAREAICSHTFIVYIDKNCNIRDYFITDFQIKIPETSMKEIKNLSTPEKEILDIDLIKLNITATLLSYILKSIFSNKKIILISEYQFLKDHINNFFKYITKDSFKHKISIISRKSYKNNKKLYRDAMVFEGMKIINNVNDLINPKKLNVEKTIVNKFLTSKDLWYGNILLKNEILKAYKFAQSIIEFEKTLKQDEVLTSKRIINHFLEAYNTKIDINYLEWLLEIIKNYFDINLNIKSEVFDFLGY